MLLQVAYIEGRGGVPLVARFETLGRPFDTSTSLLPGP
jgi:hypothetical protein